MKLRHSRVSTIRAVPIDTHRLPIHFYVPVEVLTRGGRCKLTKFAEIFQITANLARPYMAIAYTVFVPQKKWGTLYALSMPLWLFRDIFLDAPYLLLWLNTKFYKLCLVLSGGMPFRKVDLKSRVTPLPRSIGYPVFLSEPITV